MTELSATSGGQRFGVLRASALLVAAYILSGKLGLMLALPPGYASAIFPPAGIAVAAVLIGGARLLPAVFLGSLLLNIWVAWSSNSQLGAVGVSAAVTIAVASMLQAGAGGWLLRRVIGYPAPLDSSADIRNFLLAAPAICLVSASVSVTSLLVLGVFGWRDYLTNWATWWIGDTIGVLVLLPLAMVIAGEPRALWRKRASLVAVPMILSFGIFTAIYVRVNDWERDESLQEFRTSSERLLSQIRAELEAQAAMIEQLERFFSRPQNVARKEFHDLVQKAFVRYPNLQSLSWNPRVAAPERPGFERAQRIDLAGFEIRERAASGALVRADRRDEYFPVTLLEPITGNENALGYDVASSPERRETMLKAFSGGLAAVTPPVRLVQEKGSQAGLLVLMPVFDGTARKGVVVSALRMGTFLDKLLSPVQAQLLVRFIDAETKEKLYDNFARGDGDSKFQRSFDFGGRKFSLETTPTGAYLDAHRGWQSWSVLAAGLFGTGLLGALLMLGSGHTARVESLVDERTSALGESEDRLRTITDQVPALIGYIDREMRFRFNNRTYEDWYGIGRTQITGRTMRELLGDKPYSVAEPYIEKALAGQEVTFETEFARGGATRYFRVHYVPHFGPQKQVLGFYSLVNDMTERKLAEQELILLARYDALTGLPNRNTFNERVTQAIARAARSRKPLALMYLDIDRFKSINDTHGHAGGDAVLKEFAARLTRGVRATDTVARLSGDEFAIVLEGLNLPDDAGKVAAKILVAMASAFQFENRPIPVSTSIGISFSTGQGLEPETLIKQADAAMYRAKRSGRNNYQIYSAGDEKTATDLSSAGSADAAKPAGI